MFMVTPYARAVSAVRGAGGFWMWGRRWDENAKEFLESLISSMAEGRFML
jgi:hypothetical protein